MRDGVKDWLEDNSDWLMVIDNADTYGDFFEHADVEIHDTIRDALPLPRPGSAMIVYTSRHARIGEELTEHHSLHINNLSTIESKSLLINKLGTLISDEHALALLSFLKYLPMSIAHAAAYLKFTHISIQEYLRRIEHDAGLLELLDSHHVNVGRRHAKAPLSVVKVLLTTLDLLALHKAYAANLLYLMVCLDRQNIAAPTVIIAIGERTMRQRTACGIELPESDTDLESAIAELESLALIARRGDGQSFTMHRLVQVTILQRLATKQTYLPYLLLCAHCVMETHVHGISTLLTRHNNAHLIGTRHTRPDHKAQQSLAQHPKGFRVGLSLLCRLGVFSYALDKSLEASGQQIAWLRTICLFPMEAILAAAKYHLEVGGYISPSKSQRFQAMVNLCAEKSFEKLEKLSLRTIQESTTHSICMVAAKFYLARAVANIALDPNSTSITRRSASDLIREASEAADAVQSETIGFSSRYDYHRLLIAIYIEAGDRAKAIKLQARACEELVSTFGSKDLDVLRYRTLLAELRGPNSVTWQELRDLEHDLQKVYDRMHKSQKSTDMEARSALVAINHLSRAKVLSCRKMRNDLKNQATYRDMALPAALADAKRTLNDSLMQMDSFHGFFSVLTIWNVYQVHEFLKDFGSPREAGGFAFRRANLMLTQLSTCKELDDSSIRTIEESIKLFVQHDCARQLCERILFRFLRHLQTRRSSTLR